MKLPHPWWHWFFMKWIDTWTPMGLIFDPKYTYVTHYCSKCRCKYVIQYNDIDRPLGFEIVEVEK